MEEPPNLTALCQRAAAGSRAAQAELLDRLQDRIFRFCMSQLREVESAREATQEVALRLLRQLGSFRPGGLVTTWVLGIALNVCRESKRQRRWSGLEPEDCGLNYDPSQPLRQQEDAEILQRMLNRLAPRQREAIVLRYFEQLSLEQTAEVMGISLGATKATLAQAMEKLRQAFAMLPGDH